MSIFKRIKDVTLANINSLIEKAEDPEKMLEQYIREMEDDILDAEKAVAQQIAIEKKFKKSLEEAVAMVEKRTEQAIKAVETGDDNLARRALEDKNTHQVKVDEFQKQYEVAKENADKLRSQLSDMKRELDKMKGKKDILKSRAQAAKSQKAINQAVSGIGKDNATKGFARMEEKVLNLEAEAEASEELTETNKTLDAELDALNTSSVDDELAILKAKLNKKEE